MKGGNKPKTLPKVTAGAKGKAVPGYAEGGAAKSRKGFPNTAKPPKKGK